LVALRSRRRLGRAISRKVRRIGVFVPGSVQTHGQYVTAFRNELNTLRYAEGTDYVLLVRWGEGSLDRFSDYARELATAVKGQTSIIPVIFVRVADPSASGFVKSLAERLELAHAAIPTSIMVMTMSNKLTLRILILPLCLYTAGGSRVA
jgi:hypothetical protein